MPCYIEEDGRVVLEARVRVDKTGDSEIVRLVVDTGSHLTIISLSTANTLIARDPESGIQRVDMGEFEHFGRPYRAVSIGGVSLEVEVEDVGGGNSEVQSKGEIAAHDITDTELDEWFLPGAEGLFGMDQLDALGVDLVKNGTGTRAYLARRI